MLLIVKSGLMNLFKAPPSTDFGIILYHINLSICLKSIQVLCLKVLAMAEGNMDRKSKLEELIHRKRQEQEDEIQAARKRPRDDEIDNIDFGDDSDEDVNPSLHGAEETGVFGQESCITLVEVGRWVIITLLNDM